MDTLEHIFLILLLLAILGGGELLILFFLDKNFRKIVAVIVGCFLVFWVGTTVVYKNVLLVGEDGESLKYATVYVVESGEPSKRRTSSRGRIRVNRFTLDSITLDGLRYPRQTWESSIIKSKLIAKKNIIGKGVDSALNKIFKE